MPIENACNHAGWHGSALALSRGVTDDELDKLMADVGDPSLIPGIYNYCDRRCERCAFTARCFQFRLARAACTEYDHTFHEDRRRNRDDTLALHTGGSLERAVAVARALGERLGLDATEPDRQSGHESGHQPGHQPGPSTERGSPAASVAVTQGTARGPASPIDVAAEDSLVTLACRYAADVHPIVRVLEPIVALRADQASIRAVAEIDWLATLVSSKTFRAVLGAVELELSPPGRAWSSVEGARDDVRGSAKCARLFIAASIASWRVLMEVGRASANGVPAKLVQVLADLDAGLAARFPDAMAFVRPGFDEIAPAPDAISAGTPWDAGADARPLSEVKVEQ